MSKEKNDLTEPRSEVRILSTSQNIIYNFPNLGIQAQYALTTNFLIIFYINILGQPPLIVGGIQSAFIFLGAFLCPIWGALCDKFSTKFGRKKIFMLFTGPIVALFFTLIWMPPIPDTKYGTLNVPLIVWFTIFGLLYNIGSSAYQTTYLSLIPDLSTDETNRVRISMLNMLFMIAGAGIGMFIPVILLGTATESLSRDNPSLFIRSSPVGQTIYYQVIWFAAFLSLLFFVGFILMLWKIKEPDVHVEQRSSIKKLFKEILDPLKDTNFRIYLVSFFLMFVSIGAFEVLILNFATFVINLRGDEFLLLAIVALIAAAASFFIFDTLSKKIGLKKVMFLCLIVASIAFISIFLLIIPMPHELVLVLGIIIVAFCLASFVGAMIFPMAIVSNIVDAAKMRTGKNLSGSYIGTLTMASSLASAVTILLISIFLEIFGTETNISYILIFFVGGILMILGTLAFKNVNLTTKVG